MPAARIGLRLAGGGLLMLRLLAALAFGYALLVVLMFLGQSRLLHLPNLPGRELMATPERFDLAYEEVWFESEDGVSLHGWYLPGPEARHTLLFLHGNAGNISHRLDSLRIFHDLGLNVFIFDYRGYGRSEGRPSEAGLRRDARAALAMLSREFGAEKGTVIAFGRSLGGALAACLAAEHDLAAAIIESSFTSVPELAAELYPFLPVRWLARLDYGTEACLAANESTPVLVVHSPDDEIIPFHHGERLAASPHARLLAIRGDHNTGFLRSGDLYRRGLADFLDELR